MNNISIDILKHQKLKNGQTLAFFSYHQIFKHTQLELSALAKTASAMANAVGGHIVIGLKIEKTKFAEWEAKPKNMPKEDVLAGLINTYIHPKLDLLHVETIEGGILISIPQSYVRPHMFTNYKFYKRLLSKNVVMEEFEIRQAYQASAASNLQIIGMDNLQGIPQMLGGRFAGMKFYPRIHIQNLGQHIEKIYKLEISLPSALVDESFTVLHKYLKGYKKDYNIYSISGTEPLFQDETKTMIELVLKLNLDNYEVFTNSKIVLKLYSSTKVHERTFVCKEWFHYQGKLPQIESFIKKIEE